MMFLIYFFAIFFVLEFIVGSFGAITGFIFACWCIYELCIGIAWCCEQVGLAYDNAALFVSHFCVAALHIIGF